MTANDLNALLVVLIAANVVLLVVAIIWSRVRRRRASAALQANRTQLNRPEAQRVGLAPSTISRGYSTPASSEPDQLGRDIDRLTGLLGPTDWNRLVADEDVRHARYKRAATIVIIELDGFERLTTALGQLAADRVIVAVTDTIRRHARKSDRVARLGPSRFGVLLPETDEIAAINYVERVRQASDLWLESGAISLRLAIGWASPVVDTGVVSAQAQAIERMYAEVRHSARQERGPEAGPTDPLPGLRGAPSAI
jgi:diguanylate cyclase (GGDEF)-like protein